MLERCASGADNSEAGLNATGNFETGLNATGNSETGLNTTGNSETGLNATGNSETGLNATGNSKQVEFKPTSEQLPLLAHCSKVLSEKHHNPDGVRFEPKTIAAVNKRRFNPLVRVSNRFISMVDVELV